MFQDVSNITILTLREGVMRIHYQNGSFVMVMQGEPEVVSSRLEGSVSIFYMDKEAVQRMHDMSWAALFDSEFEERMVNDEDRR